MKAIKIIGRSICWILAACCFAVVLATAYTAYLRNAKGETCPTVFGIGSAVVISGSMEDAISIDDLIITLKRDTYEVGDIVMYDGGSSPVTHRIIEKNGDTYITKGDANNVEDKAPVEESKIAGKVILVVPGVGKVIAFMQTQLGIMIMILGALILLIAPSFLRREEKEE